MKKIIACVIAGTMFGIAVLGFRTMVHGSDHMPADCAATILGMRCGEGLFPLAGAASHVDTVKAFTLAVLFAAVAVTVWSVVRRAVVEDLANLSPPRVAFEVAYSSHPLLMRRRRWLALREKRDPSARVRVYEGSSLCYP